MSRPVGAARATVLLAAHELRLTARRGENVLVTLIIPPAVLLFFATTGLVPAIAGRPVDYLLPGALALAIIASGLVSLGISTAYDRQYGVLKRLGGAPVTRASVIASRILAVLAIEVLQAVVLVAVAVVALGWRPADGVSPLLLGAAALLGTLAFAGLGLLLAGTLRAEAVLALANGLFLASIMVGGIILPIDHLPGAVEAVARWLPAGALTDLFRAALGSGADPVPAFLVVGAWGLGAAGLAMRTFRWD